jgi:hypothetical protein
VCGVVLWYSVAELRRRGLGLLTITIFRLLSAGRGKCGAVAGQGRQNKFVKNGSCEILSPTPSVFLDHSAEIIRLSSASSLIVASSL